MTDELDRVEMHQGMVDQAALTHAFYEELRKQGFLHEDAMRLTAVWLRAIVMGAAVRPDEDDWPDVTKD